MKMTQILMLAMRMLAKEWRSGDIAVITLSLMIAALCYSSITSVTDRLNQLLISKGHELIAADLSLKSAFPLLQAWREETAKYKLTTAEITDFRSIVYHQDESAMVEAKAVSDRYPLRGEMMVSDSVDAAPVIADGIPNRGEAWAESALLDRLNLRLGQSINLGEMPLRVTKILDYEPDRGGVLFSIAPRLLFNLGDLPKTDVIRPGSIVNYRLLVAGSIESVNAFRQWINDRYKNEVVIRDIENANPRLQRISTTAERYFGIAALISILLAGIAIMRSTQYYVERHTDNAALLKTLGLTQRSIFIFFVGQLLCISLVAGLLGALAGYALQFQFTDYLNSFIKGSLPAATLTPVFKGLLLAISTVLAFSVPHLIRLKNISPVQIFRKDLTMSKPGQLMVFGAIWFYLCAVVVYLSKDIYLTAWVVGIITISLTVLISLGYGFTRSFFWYERLNSGIARLSLANFYRNARSSHSEKIAIAVAVLSAMVLTLVKDDLLDAWLQKLPLDTPNQFYININPDQRAAFAELLENNGAERIEFAHLARARITRLNGESVSSLQFDQPFAQRILSRAANVSWRSELSIDNSIVQGRFWSSPFSGAPEVSLEASYAQALGLSLNDSIDLQIAGTSRQFTVTSIRKVDWDSFKPNFFIIIPPGFVEPEQATLISSAYIPASEAGRFKTLVKDFPNITNIDVSSILKHVRSVIGHLDFAFANVLVYVVISALIVLFTSFYTTRKDRYIQMGVLRALGAKSLFLGGSLFIEYFAIGLVASLAGCVGALITAYVLSIWVFELPFTPDFGEFLAAAFAAATAVAVIAVAVQYYSIRNNTRNVLQHT